MFRTDFWSSKKTLFIVFYDPKYKQYHHFQLAVEGTVKVAMLFTLAYAAVLVRACWGNDAAHSWCEEFLSEAKTETQ